MKKSISLFLACLILATAAPSFAELQNVSVNGLVRIRGNYYDAPATSDSWTVRNRLFEIPWTSSYRGIGGNPLAGYRWPATPGRQPVWSAFSWNSGGNSSTFVEQRTKLSVRADFTNQVNAFVELDSYDIWGEDFRSIYLTGQDQRAVTNTDVEVYQSYIEANEMYGQPLRLRLGRQEMKFGSGFLVGTNDLGPGIFGCSFDGIRGTYATDQFTVDAFWTKLAEASPNEEDGDIDFYGLYASYLGIENVTIDAYYLLLRDAGVRFDTPLIAGPAGQVAHWWESFWGADDYDVTNINTIGLRGAGKYGPVDFDAEIAYQFGNASAVGRTFAGAGLRSPYGDDDADFSTWAGNVEVGYTFDIPWNPRVYVNAAYFGGEDNRDTNFAEWLAGAFCPFYHQEASVSFNRLFSDKEYSYFIDSGEMSNMWLATLGVSATPTEQLTVTLYAMYMESLDNYDSLPSLSFLGTRVVPIWAQVFPWAFSRENSGDLGWELFLSAKYQYSEDLAIEVGWCHLFVGEGLEEGNFNSSNGLAFNGGTSGDDANHFYFETQLKF